MNVILEKEKGLILGKLCIIQLIKADFQLLIRVFVNKRIKSKIKNGIRILNANYRSRSRYSIEDLIFGEKITIPHKYSEYGVKNM